MLIDANLLLYLTRRIAREHEAVTDWFTEAISGASMVGMPWVSLTAFLRIATHPRASEHPMQPLAAWEIVEDWLDIPNVWVPEPGVRHREILAGLIEKYEPRGNLLPDAVLAALAIEHGLTICSADTDFARFTEVEWHNPAAR